GLVTRTTSTPHRRRHAGTRVAQSHRASGPRVVPDGHVSFGLQRVKSFRLSESVRPVLVTGGSGFIGRPLLSALLAERVRVRVIVRGPDALRSLQALGAETIRGDVLDQSTLDRAVGGVRGIFHLAGRLLVAGSRAEDYTRLHVEAPQALINTCI